jgi:hypothetical protein
MNSVDPSMLSNFILDGQALRERSTETPLPIEAHNSWVDRMNEYFEQSGKPEYKVRLSDFSGMVFLGDSSEKSQFEKSIDGRLQRLHEFLKEAATSLPPSRDDIVLAKPSVFGLGIDLRAALRRFRRNKK